MSSKLSSFILAALVIGSGVASAAVAATEPDESGIPDSIDYPDRGVESASNEEIEAGESANPESVSYRERFAVSSDEAVRTASIVIDR
jgi:hypothetical protein